MLKEFTTKGLRELNTPFGKLYIEPWEWHKDNKFPYYCDDRITIYDSRGNWFDYFPVDYFYTEAAELMDLFVNGRPKTSEADKIAEEEYEKLCEMLEKGAGEETLDGFLDWLGLNYDYAGPDKAKAADSLSCECSEALLPDELETNEYVNHIGDNYIVISEF